GQLGDRAAQRLAAAWGARRVELERDPRPVAGLVVQRGGAHRRPRAQKNACITIDSIEPGGSTLPRGRLPLGVAAASTSHDSRPRWMVFLDGTACPDTSQGVSRPEIAGAGPLYPPVRIHLDGSNHRRSGFPRPKWIPSAPGWAERAHPGRTSLAPHP